MLIDQKCYKATPTESVVSRPPPALCLSICIKSPLLSLFSNYAKKFRILYCESICKLPCDETMVLVIVSVHDNCCSRLLIDWTL